jgi:cell wall-associated NlpC family hydrolase
MMILTTAQLKIEGFSAKENQQAAARLQRILNEWEGTPHMDGQQCKGRGVDCVRFVAAVLDEMSGTKTPLEHLPRDASFHDKAKCIGAFKRFLTLFEASHVPEEEPKQPGDVFITGPESGGPGHAIILGTDGQLWQALDRVGGYAPDLMNTGLYKYKTTLRVDKSTWREHHG